MKAIPRVLSFFDDAINPITVKELRQAVQSRFVTAVLVLFLLGQLGVVGYAVMFNEDITRHFDSGRGIFSVLLGVLLFTCIIFVPAYAGARLSSERSDTNVDLFFITTLRPGAIVRGKLLAAMILAMLIFGACMPFMTFTYLLRGLDIPSIFLTLLLGLVSTTVAVMFSLFLAAIPLGRFLRGLLGLILLAGLFTLLSMTVSGSMGIVHFGIASRANSKEFWGFLGTVAVLAATGIGFFYVLALACLSPASSNRSMPFRIFIPAVVLINGLVYWLWADSSGDEDFIVGWMLTSVFFLCFFFLIVVSDRDTLTRRVKRQIPRFPLLRILVFPFFSGVTSGVLWWLLLMAGIFFFVKLIMLSQAAGTSSFRYTIRTSMFESIITFSLYMYCYCMTALFLRRAFLSKVHNTAFTSVIALSLMILGCVVPVFFAFLGDAPRHWDLDDAGYWSMGNPFSVLYGDADYRTSCLALTVFWAVIASAVNLPWTFRHIGEFTPTPTLTRGPKSMKS